MSRHTQGPWNIHPAYRDFELNVLNPPDGGDPYCYSSSYIAQGEKIICEVRMDTCTNGGWPNVSNLNEMIANAYLIKEAPSMLEMLEQCLGHIEKLHSLIPGLIEEKDNEMVAELKKLVARATNQPLDEAVMA
jgi:hypothetical protein